MTAIRPHASKPPLAERDPAVSDLLKRESTRQQTHLSLIASENHASRAVREACASYASDKYAEGYPGARYYGGCEILDDLERLAIERAKELFGAEHANVQPHSGTTANFAVLAALAGVGGRIVGMSLAEGGHLSHGFKASHSGKFFDAAHYGVRVEDGLLDYDAVESVVAAHKPKVLIAGGSSYPRKIDWERFAQIARDHKALLLADIAHPAGLIAARVLESPIDHADVVTMTTHKTLRGARGGMILCKDQFAKKIQSSVFPGGQGGPLMHQIAGKAVAFGEALHPAFHTYQKDVVANAARLADKLTAHGLQIVTGGTDSHIVVADLRSQDATGAEVEERAMAAGIVVNKNMVPGDERSARVTSGIRVGTAAITTRGLGLEEMDVLSEILADLIAGGDPKGHRATIKKLCSDHPLP